MSFLSLYIPVIQEHITEAYIKRQFLDHNIGKIMRVDFVKNVKKNRREAFLHFDEWFKNDASKALQEDIQNCDTKTRFVYKNNKYFPLFVNKSAHKRINNPDYNTISSDEVKKYVKDWITISIDKSCQDTSNVKRTKM